MFDFCGQALLNITFTAKIPRDHEFPAVFHVCRLLFAVFNACKEACSRVRQQREYSMI